jgi:hypothetical protein
MVSHGGLRESKIGGDNESNGMPLQTVLANDRLRFKQLCGVATDEILN